MTSARLICLAMDLWTRSGIPDPDPEHVLSSSISLMVVAWKSFKSLKVSLAFALRYTGLGESTEESRLLIEMA